MSRTLPGWHLASLTMLASSVVALLGCSRQPARADVSLPTAGTAAPAAALILAESEGERRVRRPRTEGPAGLSAPLIIKVDGTNGGSSQLFMGYEDIPAGEGITRHYHPHADEILFLHRGHGVATLGERQAEVGAGTTIYIPHGTRVSLRNTGSEPIAIAFIFADAAMSSWFRDGSALEGEPAPPMTPADIAARRARHRDHIVHEP